MWFYIKIFNVRNCGWMLTNNEECINWFVIHLHLFLGSCCIFWKRKYLRWVFIFMNYQTLVEKQGKAGGHEPPLFPLSGHILAFFSSGTVWFSKFQPRHAINIHLNLYISVLIWNKDVNCKTFFCCKSKFWFS